MADTAEINPVLRSEGLAVLARAIQGQATALESLGQFATQQEDEAERRLIEGVPACLRWLQSIPAEDRDDIRSVLLRINEGQALDLQRFAEVSRVTALASAEELLRYTYLVAGSVGEFWTSVCCRHLRYFADRPQEEMMSLGRDYGTGLQLVNILRDAGADLRAGRCYLPANELQAVGIAIEELDSAPERAFPVLEAWREQALKYIARGIDYCSAIQPMRVRLATALPALIGTRTLALLREAGPRVFGEKVKVTRSEVRKIIFETIRSRSSPAYLRRAFAALSSD